MVLFDFSVLDFSVLAVSRFVFGACFVFRAFADFRGTKRETLTPTAVPTARRAFADFAVFAVLRVALVAFAGSACTGCLRAVFFALTFAGETDRLVVFLADFLTADTLSAATWRAFFTGDLLPLVFDFKEDLVSFVREAVLLKPLMTRSPICWGLELSKTAILVFPATRKFGRR
ncbi:MAG: hypothetical protein ACRD63_11725 [Pyrinomonadaceae bacterium]